MNLESKGYAILGYVFLAGMSIALLFMTFGNVKCSREQLSMNSSITDLPNEFAEMFVDILSSTELPVVGSKAQITIGSVSLPYWVSTILIVMGCLMATMNLLKFGAFRSWLIISLFTLPLFQTVWIVTMLYSHGKPSIGGFLALACPAVGVIMATLFDPKASTNKTNQAVDLRERTVNHMPS
ncbi:MAG: hypothetical protein U0941_24755 [Planctomycetaceae bacterium]